MRRPIAIALCATVLLVTKGSAQSLTIPQAVERARPGPLVITRVSEMAAASFEAAVRDADLIVKAALTKQKTYLSDDKMKLYTDYTVVPIDVISEKHGQASDRPALLPITLRVWGGETTISGVVVNVYNENFPTVPVGQPLLLFLAFDGQTGKYDVYDNGSGAFELREGRALNPLIKPADVVEPRLLGMDIDDAVREIHQRGR